VRRKKRGLSREAPSKEVEVGALPKSIAKYPFFLVYVYAVLLLVGAMIPGNGFFRLQKANKIFSVLLSDNAFHFFGFGILAWLLCYGYHRAKMSRMPYLRAGIFSLAYGLFIELVQIPLPYRFFSMKDFAFDAAGIVVGLFGFCLFRRKYKL
jgi:VanZ family protein